MGNSLKMGRTFAKSRAVDIGAGAIALGAVVGYAADNERYAHKGCASFRFRTPK